MVKEKTQVNVRLEAEAAEALGAYADTLTGAATLACGLMPIVVARGLAELRGRFTEAELKLVLDALNGVGLGLLYSPSGAALAGQHLVITVRDAIELNAADAKWGVFGSTLVEKLEGLSVLHRIALELWTVRLWRACEDDALWTREIERLAGGAR